MIVIALGHRSRTGKDTLAKFLKNRIIEVNPKLDVKICGFADKLKEACQLIYGWAGVKSGQYYEEHPEEREIIIPQIGKSVVQLWIDFGEHGRIYDPMMWVRPMFENPNTDVLIIKDLRNLIECDFVDMYDGGKYKIEKSDVPHRPNSIDDNLANYENWTDVFKNDGDLNALYAYGCQIVDRLRIVDLVKTKK